MVNFEQMDLIPLIVFVTDAKRGRVVYANPVAKRRGIDTGANIDRFFGSTPGFESACLSAEMTLDDKTFEADIHVSEIEDEKRLFVISSLKPFDMLSEDELVAQICDFYMSGDDLDVREFLRMTAQAVRAFNAALYEKRNGRYILRDEWRARKNVCIPILSADFEAKPDEEAARLTRLKRANDAAYGIFLKEYGTQGALVYFFDEPIDSSVRAIVDKLTALYKMFAPESSKNDYLTVVRKGLDVCEHGLAIWDYESQRLLYGNKLFQDLYGTQMFKGKAPPELRTATRTNSEYKDAMGRTYNITHVTSRVRGSVIVTTTLTDITKYKLTENRLETLAQTDALTGLKNRRAGLEVLDTLYEQSKRDRRPLTVCFADIDGLKRINDSFGHDMGDNMIRIVAHILKKHVGTAGTVCRLGGDEFVIILPGYDKEKAVALSSQIERAVDKSFAQKPQSVTISFGFKEADYMPEETSATLISVADLEMYREKTAKPRI